MSKKVLSLIVSLFLYTLLPFTPQNAQALNSPEKISTTSNEQIQPAITTDSDGKVHTVWVEDLGNGTTNLIYRFWNGQVWSTPTTIASGAYSELPSITPGANNTLHLTWDSDANPSGAWQVYHSTYNGSTWSSPVAISGSNPSDVAWDSEIALDSSGNPHVAYTNIPAGTVGNKRYTYYTRYNGASWETPIDITQSGTFHQYPAIGADSAGNVHVVWKSDLLGQFEILHRMWNGSTFTSQVSISGIVAAAQEPQPRIAIGNNNNAHVVWEERITDSSDFRIMYSKWTGSSWSSPFTVSQVAQQTVEGVPSVAVLRSSLDDVLVGWIDKTTDPRKLGFRKFNASSQSWEISRANDIQQASPDFPVATMDKWDNVHVAWGEASSTGKYETYYDAIPLAAKIIGTSGGTLTTFNGDTLTIPSGAISQDTIISAQVTPLSNAAPEGSNTPNRQYVFEPTGQVFSSPATAVFTYMDAEFSGANEKNIGIYVWDSSTSQWVFKTGTLNKGSNTVTFTLDHFSIYSFFSVPDVINWTKPLSEDVNSEFSIGRTIPIKFSLVENGHNPDDISVQIANSSGTVVTEFETNHGKDTVRYDSQTGEFITNLETKDLPTGLYQVNVLDGETFLGSIQFILN